jgi:stage II sporulation protein AA (anti-sigma F factor antagonist)
LTLGGRGLVLLESRSVMLSNGTGEDGRHWIMATVWLATESWITSSPNGCRTVRPMGRLDHGKVKRFEATLMPLINDSSTRGIVLDLTDVEYISSVSFRVMMLAKRAARQRGIALVAVALQPVVAEQFHISRFDKVMPIFETRGQAEAAVGEGLPS